MEVDETLKGMYEEHDALQYKEKKASEELKMLRLVHAETQTQARANHKVLNQVEEIAVGKPFLL